MNDNYLTVQEIAEKYRVTPAAVYKWVKEGRLKAIKLGRVWRIPESALREFIEKALEAIETDGQLVGQMWRWNCGGQKEAARQR